VLAGNHDDGVIAYGGAVRLDDVVVRDTFGDKLENAWGYGIAAYMGGTLEGARVIVQRAHNTGAVALEGTTMSLEDLLVQDTAPDPYDNLYGRGVGVNGAQLTLRRALIERSFELGVAAFEGATIATLEDIVVRDTMPRACATTTCAEAPAGTGLGAYLSASMSVRRFQVTRSSLCGVQVATSGGLDLSEGEVSMAAIGACVQIDGYLTTRLTDRVVYRDNGASIQGTALPVPEAGGSLPPL